MDRGGVAGGCGGADLADGGLVAAERPEFSATLETLANALQASLDPATGRLVAAAWVDFGRGRGGRFLMVVHHLVVDGVSWRVLAEDLLSAYEQARGGRAIKLPAKGGAYRAWAEGLKDPTAQIMTEEETAYWARLTERKAEALPVDFSGGSETDTEANEATVTRTLAVAETTTLLQDFPAVQRTQTDEVLLTALVRAMAGWTGRAGLWLDVESHGREEIVAGLDLGRTVGWFTALAPVWLDLAGARDAAEAMKMVKEQWRTVPRHGIGFGLACRHGRGALADALRALSRPELVFNYLGQFDQALPTDAAVRRGVGTGGPDARGGEPAHARPAGDGARGGRAAARRVELRGEAARGDDDRGAGGRVRRGGAGAARGGWRRGADTVGFQLMGFRPDELDDLVADAKGAEE